MVARTIEREEGLPPVVGRVAGLYGDEEAAEGVADLATSREGAFDGGAVVLALHDAGAEDNWVLARRGTSEGD